MLFVYIFLFFKCLLLITGKSILFFLEKKLVLLNRFQIIDINIPKTIISDRN